MKILVTGANGFIGQAIISELFEQSHEIFAVGNSNSENKNSAIIKPENYFQADISKKTDVTDIARDREVETLIHCAGLAHRFGNIGKEDFRSINADGTEHIANLAVKLKVKHFILISSVSVYGGNFNGKLAVDEEFLCQPKDFYAESKLEGERIAKGICEGKGIALTILRPATVIGEGDRGNFLRLIKAIDRKRFIWIGKGNNKKSLIHKTDVARACLQVLHKKSLETEIFNISAEPLSIKEIVDEIALGLNKNIPKVAISGYFLQRIFSLNSKTINNRKIQKLAETTGKWMAEDVYSAEKIKSIYRFETKVSVKEAISREVKWYLTNK